jgi:hypothetical protein
MVFFTIVGMIVCGLIALALLVGLVFAAMSGRVRVGKFAPRTWFRHYAVYLPNDEPGPGRDENLAICWTFWGAKRVASRTRGTRIQNRWSGSPVVAASGWSESRNGYRAPDLYA